MAFERIGQKNTQIRITEKILSAADGVTRLSGHATALQNLLDGTTDGVVRLRQGGAAAAETITVTEQASTGYYDILFTPLSGSGTGTPYYLDFQEPAGISAMERNQGYAIQVFDSISVTPAGGSYFTTVANVKEFRSDTKTGSDALFANLVARATREIQSYLNRTVFQDSYVALRDGSNLRSGLQLAEWPVASITTLHESLIQTWDSTTLIPATDYLFDPTDGRLRRTYGQRFLDGFQNVRCEYVGGEATTPEDIEQACILRVGVLFESRQHLTVQSVNLGDGSRTTRRGFGFTDEIRFLLERYRNEGVRDAAA